MMELPSYRVLAPACCFFFAMLACTDKKMPPYLQNPGRSPGSAYGGSSGAREGGAASMPTALATAQPNPRAIATDGAYVYFTCTGDGGPNTGSVRRVPKAGGSVEELATTLDAPYAIVLAKGEAIFSEHAPSMPAGNIRAISQVPGGTTRTLLSATETPSWLVTDGATWVYYPTSANGAGVTIRRVALSGGTTQDVAQALGSFSPGGIVLANDDVYFTTGEGIARVRTTGGGAEILDQEAGAAFGDLALAGDRVWAIDDEAKVGRVVSVPTSGGAPRVDVTQIDRPAHIASDGRWVYFTSNVADGSVGAVSIADGTVEVVATGLVFPWAIAVDDAVYVTTQDSVVKIPKL